ncbi:uncharacterized protein HGUI_01757 [Hanseniaspora guilliermondii]|uniref:Sphingoid long-chain base transporter RSB1 n=1 Tax=Hanseniaspora guilliermondii TaxID=56406 RepID=A0A1L0CL24_9ASCO|nr:uncharacterized protein HGUI_01757 [Hanseniaspora guilliermondii]
MSSYFNKTAAKLAATAAGTNLTAIAEIYKGHEELSPNSMYSGYTPSLLFNGIAMIIFFAYLAWNFILCVFYKNKFFGICMMLYLAGQGVGEKVVKLNVFGKRAQPILISFLFITFDIVCLFIQGIGGGVEGGSVNSTDLSIMELGNHIFVAGLALQTISMSIFLIVYAKLIYNIFIRQRIEFLNKQKDIASHKRLSYNGTFFAPWKWNSIRKCISLEEIDPIMCNVDTSGFGNTRMKLFNTYPVAVFLAFGFAVIRCIYRLVELADGGFTGFLIKHEEYLIALDFTPLSISGFIMCLYAEGLVFGRRGLLEISIIKKCAYRGLSSWKEFKIECRCLFGMKVDNERLNKQFENMNKEEFRHDNYSIDMMDYSNNGYNQYSHAEPYNTQYLKKTAFFKRTLAQKLNSSWW